MSGEITKSVYEAGIAKLDATPVIGEEVSIKQVIHEERNKYHEFQREKVSAPSCEEKYEAVDKRDEAARKQRAIKKAKAHRQVAATLAGFQTKAVADLLELDATSRVEMIKNLRRDATSHRVRGSYRELDRDVDPKKNMPLYLKKVLDETKETELKVKLDLTTNNSGRPRVNPKPKVVQKVLKAKKKSKYDSWKAPDDDLFVEPPRDEKGKPIEIFTEAGIEYGPAYNISDEELVLDLLARCQEAGDWRAASEEFPFLLNIVTFLIQIFNAKGKLAYGTACYQFATIVTLKFPAARDIVTTFIKTTQSMWPKRTEASTLEELVETFNMVLSSDLVDALRLFILQLVSYKMFDKDLAIKCKDLLGGDKPMSFIDFITFLGKNLVNFIRLGEAYMQGLPISSFWFANDPIQDIVARTKLILANSENTYSGLPVDGMMPVHDYIMQLQECILAMEAIIGKKYLSPKKKFPLIELLPRAVLSFNEKKNAVESANRATPVAVILNSPPGVGKSFILMGLMKEFCVVLGYDFKPCIVFHQNINSEYIECYEPHSHKLWHISELGSVSSDIVKTRGDPVTQFITSMIDRLPVVVNSAFEGKGKVKVLIDGLFIDTNLPDLNLSSMVRNPAAYRRRFLYVQVEVMSEYKVDGSYKLDKKKSLASEAHPMDRWLYTMYLMNPDPAKPNTQSIRQNLLFKVRWAEFAPAYREYIKQHFEDEYKVMEQEKKMLEMESAWEPVTKWWNRHSDELHCKYESAKETIRSTALYGVFCFSYLTLVWYYFFLVNLESAILCVMPLCPRVVQYPVRGFIKGFARPYIDQVRLAMDNDGSVIMRSDPKYRYIIAGLAFFATLTYAYFGRNRIPDKKVNSSDQSVIIENVKHRFNVNRDITFDEAMQMLRTNTRDTQATNFRIDEPENVELNSLETLSGCGETARVIPNKTKPDYWNLQHIAPNEKCLNQPDEIFRTVNANMRTIRFPYNGVYVRTNILGIWSNYAIVNKHSLKDLEIISVELVVDSGLPRFFEIRRSDMIDLGNDVLYFKVKHTNFKDIRDLVGKDFPNLSCPAYIYGRMTRAHFMNVPLPMEDTIMGSLLLDKYISYEYSGHYPGLCGTPVIAQTTKGWHVVGIHVAGDNKGPGAYSTSIIGLSWPVIDDNILPIASEGNIIPENMMEPGVKSPFRFEEFHNIKYFGKLPGVTMMNSTSEIRHTPYFKEIPTIMDTPMSIDGKWIYGPPPMKPFTGKDGIYYSPFNNALRKFNRGQYAMNKDALNITYEIIMDKIKPYLVKTSPLTVEEAINGLNDTIQSRRINVRTAAGLGFKGKKMLYLPVVQEEPLVREPVKVLKEVLIAKLREMEKSRTTGTIYKASPKDEARENAKNKIGMTRIFYGSSIDALIIYRMYLQPLFSILTSEISRLYCAIGIDMHKEAKDLIAFLLENSDLFIEGDIRGFEFNIPFEICELAASILYNIAKIVGYNDSALKITATILTEMLFPIYEMLNDIFQAPGSQPSGAYATAEFNSLKHLVLLIYGYVMITKRRDFFQQIRAGVYGDDLTGTVASLLKEVFNNITYAKFLGTIGVEFTPTDKDGEHKALLNITECSFLKRQYRYHKVLAQWVAPLNKVSICKALMLYIPSKTISRELQLVETINAMSYEMFLWSDSEEDYDKFRDSMIQLAVTQGYGQNEMEDYFLTFAQMRSHFD